MKKTILFLVLISVVFAQGPIIKIEGQDFLKALGYIENSPYTKLYDWNIGDTQASPIVWDPNGNNWTPEGFERKGKVYLGNQGKITHTIVDTETKPGYWTLLLLGNKDKIVKATLVPNKATLENPSINIDKAFIKEQIVCEENDKIKDTVYRIKFPQKLSFWMKEKTTISTQGNKSEYVISFDKKPACATKATTNKTSSSNNISGSTKEQIRHFLNSFYKSGEESFPAKTLQYYDSKVDRYFSMKNVSKEDILEDKIRYYKKWTTRRYNFKDFEVIDSHITDGIQYYVVSTVADWNVTSAKGKSRNGISYNIITLIENDNGFLVKGIKSLSGKTATKTNDYIEKSLDNTGSFTGNNKEELYRETREAKKKTISFQENGISIYLTYPGSVKAGQSFKIRAEMTNNNARAKQGGLTLSFPDMRSMRGKVLSNNFASLKGYSAPDKIYNKDMRKSMRTEYFMVEGWQNKTWSYGRTKYFTVELRAPKNLNKLYVNLRGVLWIRNKHDLREIPLRSSIYDQQGFAVKQFSIHVN